MTQFLSFTIDTPSGACVWETKRGTRQTRRALFSLLKAYLVNGSVTKVRVNRLHFGTRP